MDDHPVTMASPRTSPDLEEPGIEELQPGHWVCARRRPGCLERGTDSADDRTLGLPIAGPSRGKAEVALLQPPAMFVW